MTFRQAELGFQPGLYSNRSARASKGRWVDGNLVRFRDGVPAQIGGWKETPVLGVSIAGRPSDMIAWRPNDLGGRYAAIGTHSHAFVFDGSYLRDITPTGFVAGRTDTQVGAGFGAGPYGAGSYGTPRPVSGISLDVATWTFDMFGEVLLGSFNRDGQIYRYRPGTDVRLVPLTNAPSARALCVSDERHVFAFGCDGNPNLVRWSDREAPTVWTPAPVNRAGSYDMQATSPFQCGRRARGQVLAWTQTEMFSFTPLSNALVYARERMASECGALGPHAVAVVTDQQGDVVYWMSVSSFFVFDGTARKMACDLQDYVFGDINLLQRAKAHARVNSAFGEVWFFYCGKASNEVDRAVIYSYETGTWTKAGVSRLSWIDAGVFPMPLAIDASGTIYEHENGSTANGAPLPSYVLSHPLTFGVGQQFTELASFWPDMEPSSGACELTIIGRDYPGAPDLVFGPYAFDPSMEKIDLSVAARQIQIKVSGVSGGWELGTPLIEIQAGGMR